MTSNLLKDLNNSQVLAATHENGACLVIAGAGSGKTKTISHRIAYLIEEKSVDPASILLLTFTNKAAAEMIARVRSLSKNSIAVQGGTFHTWSLNKVNAYKKLLGFDKDSQVIDSQDSEALIKRILNDNPDIKESLSRVDLTPATIASLYSYSRNCLKSIEAVAYHYNVPDFLISDLKFIINEYNFRKRENFYFDFDDILVNMVELTSLPESQLGWMTRLKYILIDEFQDTNPLQMLLVQNLKKVTENIFVVGDDCQSIYGFRGADVSNILDFPKNFAPCKQITLSVNYRSYQPILDVGNSVMELMQEKFEKELEADKGYGGSIFYLKARNSYDLADYLVSEMKQLNNAGVPYSEMCVLMRGSMQSMELEQRLVQARIGFQKWGGRSYFDKAHVKSFISFLRFIDNKNDVLAGARVLSMIPRVGAKTAEKLLKDINLFGFSVLEDQKTNKGGRFNFITNALDSLIYEQDLPTLLSLLISEFSPLIELNHPNDFAERISDLKSILEMASDFSDLKSFLSIVVLSSQDISNSDEDGTLTLSTIHAAKGKEFSYVFLIGFYDGGLPFIRAKTAREYQEELRLMYVAVTRAKDALYLCYPAASIINGEWKTHQESPFLTKTIKNIANPILV